MNTNEPMTQERLDAIRELVESMWNMDPRFLAAYAREHFPVMLAEVERLRARPTVDKDMVERAAGTLFKQDFLERNPEADDAHAQHRLEQVRVSTPKAWGQYLQVVRAALDAALNPREGS